MTAAAPTGDLESLLHCAFGFSSSDPTRKPSAGRPSRVGTCCWFMPTRVRQVLVLPIARHRSRWTTLVISPLIALMEDQVAKLKERGFAVERHPFWPPRAESRQTCLDYLSGKLQFLFIAPERLRVAGFPDMLAKRPLSLMPLTRPTASRSGGHDFRPDYRMLASTCPVWRPRRVMALDRYGHAHRSEMTSAEQLRLAQPARFVHGFRRAIHRD